MYLLLNEVLKKLLDKAFQNCHFLPLTEKQNQHFYAHKSAKGITEIEFILATDEGDIVPVEVKSGKRTLAKSLASYIDKCAPNKTFKLTGTQGSSALEQTHIVMPLYFTQYLPQRW